MSKVKKIGITLLVLLAVLQFVRPTRNLAEAETPNDITHTVTVPDSIKNILVVACYDCHSNHTTYPWYTNIQPVGLWMQHHVNEAKEDLNFSEFNTYEAKRKTRKLKGIARSVKGGGMPLDSYLWIHKEAVLTQEQKDVIVEWANYSRKTLGDSTDMNVKDPR